MSTLRFGHTSGLALWLVAFLACAGTPPRSLPTSPAATTAAAQPVVQVEAGAGDPVVAAVGDIDCEYRQGHPARGVIDLLNDPKYGHILVLGDLAYDNGTQSEFKACDEIVWEPIKERVHPSPGNHDYGIYKPVKRNDAEPYFQHFGDRAGPAREGKIPSRRSYYSFDVGSWHLVSLDSMAGQVPAAPAMAEQVIWLKDDLQQATAAGRKCILAFWHHPFFSSGHHGDDKKDPGRQVGPLWDALIDSKADVIVNGHDHHYERFALQKINGDTGEISPDGIRQFIVGTGGAEIRSFEKKQGHSEEFRAESDDHGVLFLTLHGDGYSWEFKDVAGNVLDESQGPEECHDKVKS